MRHHVGSESGDRLRGGAQHAHLLVRELRELRPDAEQRSIVGELAEQELDAGVLVERRVVLGHPGQREQLGEQVLVRLRVLAHVQGLEVEPERVERPPQVPQSRGAQQVGPHRGEPGVDRLEVRRHLLRAGVRGVVVQADEPPRGQQHRAGQRRPGRAGARGEPTTDHPDRLAERHVLPRRTPLDLGVREGVGQRGYPGVDLDDPGRHRQLTLEQAQLLGVVAVEQLGRPVGGEPHHLAGDVRVAVAVTPDPRTGPHDGAALAPEALVDLGVERRDHLEQGGLVVLEPGHHLVLDVGTLVADEGGLPQREDEPAQLELELGELRLRHGVLLHRAQAVATAHEDVHPAGGLEHHPTPGLRGVRGEDRGHAGGRTHGRQSIVAVPLQQVRQPGPRDLQVTVGRRLPGGPVHPPAALLVQVLRHVGQQREQGERTDDRNGVGGADVLEQGRHLVPVGLRAPDRERRAAGRLDEIEHPVTGVLTDRLTEQGTEEPDVVPQRGHRPGEGIGPRVGRGVILWGVSHGRQGRRSM